MTLADEINKRMREAYAMALPKPECYLAIGIAQHLTQSRKWEEVAKSMGVTVASLMRSLNGNRAPSFARIVGVLNALNVRLSFDLVPVALAAHVKPPEVWSFNHQRAARVISEQLGVPIEQVKPGENLFELGADSLDVVEVIMSLEFEFDIEIPDHLIGDESALKVESLFGIVDKLHPKGAASAEVGLTTEAS